MFCNKSSCKLRFLDVRESKSKQHKIEVEMLDAKTKQGSPTVGYTLMQGFLSLPMFPSHM